MCAGRVGVPDTPARRQNCSEMCFLIGKTLVNITEAKYMDKPQLLSQVLEAWVPWVASAGPGWILESSFGSLIGGPKSYWDVGSSNQNHLK